MAFLSCCFVILVLLDITASSSVCPSEEEITERMEATETARESIHIIFSSVLNDSSGTVRRNNSLTDMEVYERIATSLNATVTPEGFVKFEEAISEIAASTYAACSAPEKSRVQADDIPELTERLFNPTSAGNISQAREVYGQLLCLQQLLTTENSTSVRKRRQMDPDFKTDLELLNEFFDMLEGHPTIVSSIFGLTDDPFSNILPTLAFVVDDTGSMSDEIASVKSLIFSFIKAERSNPIGYILTTFNDPGSCSHVHVAMYLAK